MKEKKALFFIVKVSDMFTSIAHLSVWDISLIKRVVEHIKDVFIEYKFGPNRSQQVYVEQGQTLE